MLLPAVCGPGVANKHIHLLDLLRLLGLTRPPQGPTKLPVPKAHPIRCEHLLDCLLCFISRPDAAAPRKNSQPCTEFRVKGRPSDWNLTLRSLSRPVAARNKPRRQTSLARFLLSSMAPRDTKDAQSCGSGQL